MTGDAPLRLGTVMLGVPEMPRSLAFYRGALGLPCDQRSAGFGDPDGHVLSILGPRRGGR
jgi:catechol 2,3-dioxygenase-like lactoylglutathione lyase family enzyme